MSFWSGLKRVVKTFLSSAGYVVHKSGAAILFVDSMAETYNIKINWLKLLVKILMSSSIAYVNFFTRVKSFWKKYDPETHSVTELSENDDNHHKCLGFTSASIGTINSAFTATNGYASSTALLVFMGTRDKVAFIIVGSYVGLSNFLTFQIYNKDSMVENTHYLINRIKGRETEIDSNPINKTDLIKAIIAGSLGISAMGAFSYFLTQQFFEEVLPESVPRSVIYGLSGASCATSVISATLSKGMEVYKFFDSSNNNQNQATRRTWLVIPHAIFGSLYIVSMGLSYYDSCANLSNNLGIYNDSWYEYVSLGIFAASATLLEYAFNIKPMLEDTKVIISDRISQPLELPHELPTNNNVSTVSSWCPIFERSRSNVVREGLDINAPLLEENRVSRWNDKCSVM